MLFKKKIQVILKIITVKKKLLLFRIKNPCYSLKKKNQIKNDNINRPKHYMYVKINIVKK